CGPCQQALPHMRSIAKNFQGQPLVILSVSLDTDDQRWREFIEKNGMTWLHYRDGGFTGPLSRMFGVDAIPHTFTLTPMCAPGRPHWRCFYRRQTEETRVSCPRPASGRTDWAVTAL